MSRWLIRETSKTPFTLDAVSSKTFHSDLPYLLETCSFRQHASMNLRLFPLLLSVFATHCLASVVGITTTTTLPNGTVGKSYSAVIAASGGCTPYAWALVSGELPAGVTQTPSLHTISLDLSGTPTTAATYSFTVSVTSCAGHVSQMSYRVIIQSAASTSWT